MSMRCVSALAPRPCYACLFRRREPLQSRICSTATASTSPPSSPPTRSSARETFPWLFVLVLMAIVLCPSAEVVIVTLVPVLLGALLCAMWPSPTVAAIGSLVLRPVANIDGKPATPCATDEPLRDLRVGDSVLRRGELCTVIAIDRSVVPFGVTVQNQGTGNVAHATCRTCRRCERHTASAIQRRTTNSTLSRMKPWRCIWRGLAAKNAAIRCKRCGYVTSEHSCHTGIGLPGIVSE